MKHKLKKLSDQVIVITGASSGIGLATARMAAEHGAKLVLAARNDDALQKIVEEIRGNGGEAIHVDVDVTNPHDLRRLANDAIERFGAIDTWINNAGVSVYGKLLEVDEDDHRRLFETNFWGLVNASKIAVEFLRQNGGALINIGSVLSERAIPLQGMYSASKHAVKAFTDALRLELEEEKAPISVTLIKPGAIDTPYLENAKSYLEVRPDHAPPVYDPRVVAEAILHCAEQPVRDLLVGGGSKLLAAAEAAPRIADKVLGWTMFRQQRSERPNVEGSNLHAPLRGGKERGPYEGHVMKSSVYTRASMHPVLTGLTLTAIAGAVAAALLIKPRWT